MEVSCSTTQGQSPSTNTNPNTVIDKIYTPMPEICRGSFYWSNIRFRRRQREKEEKREFLGG